MKCVKCNNDILDTAKFCNHCGAPQPQSPAPEDKSCPQCGASVAATAKFCRSCGAQLTANTEPPKAQHNDFNVMMTNQHITWKILPGQIAVKIDEQEMASYKRIKGVYVAPGTVALFYVNGKCVATLDSGSYAFDDYPDEDATKSNAVVSFLKRISRHIVNGAASLFGFDRSNIDAFGNKVFYSVVLIKGSDFPLLYDLDNVFTKNLRCSVGLHLLCKITNFNDFFANQLTDKKFVAIDAFSKTLESIVVTVANQVLSSADADAITHNQALTDAILTALQEKIAVIYPFVTITQIISLTSNHKDLEKIRALKEELYISELELEQLQARNTFKNKLQNEDNRALLLEARSQADFEALMEKIDEEKLLTQDERDKFILMLNAERQLREARTQVETDVAINQLTQTDLLSQEELMALEVQIKQRFAITELDNDHALKLKRLQSEADIDREHLNWEIAVGNKRIENQIWQQQQKDQYEIDKARNVANFQDERWEAEFDHKKQEQDRKMDLLRQATELRMQREDAEHKRKMEEKGQDYQHELDIKNADHQHDLEDKRITATMSAEQILAMSSEGASALAEKYKAEAKAKEDSITLELMQQHNAQISAILSQQNADMKDIAMASINANTRMQEERLADKEKENQRIHADAERHQDRMLESVTTTVGAVSGIKPNTLTIASTSVPGTPMPSTIFCTNCGKSADSNNIVCPHCGNTLK